MQPQNPTGPATPAGFDFRSLLHILMERGWIIATCMVIAFFLAGAHVMRAPRIFSATTVLQIEQEEQRLVKFERVMQEDLRSMDILKTIEQTLVSRPVLQRVVATNRLDEDPDLKNPETGESPNQEQVVNMLSRLVSARLRRGTRLIDVTVEHTS